MFLHQLTLQIPKTLYLNFEHYTLSNFQSISQSAIDKAFSKDQRKANHQYTRGNQRIIILNGRHTDRLGVINQNQNDECYFFTDLERTLIDIAIRPVYSGGVYEVLNAYKNALQIMDLSKLISYLDKLDYIYPYHQVIGFYLEKAGAKENAQRLFKKKMKFDFYLTYNIRNKIYSEKWKLYYPKGM